MEGIKWLREGERLVEPFALLLEFRKWPKYPIYPIFVSQWRLYYYVYTQKEKFETVF